MKKLAVALSLAMLVGGTFVSTSTVAQDTASAPVLKKGVTLRSVDGRRIGIISTVVLKDGAPTSVKIVFDSRLIFVPVSTITASADGRVMTSLSYAQIKAL